jgi:3-dehydroquinate synthetase
MNTNMYNIIEKLFKKFNLPIVLPKNVNIEEVINLMAKDKKNSNSNNIELTLVKDIGIRSQ